MLNFESASSCLYKAHHLVCIVIKKPIQIWSHYRLKKEVMYIISLLNTIQLECLRPAWTQQLHFFTPLPPLALAATLDPPRAISQLHVRIAESQLHTKLPTNPHFDIPHLYVRHHPSPRPLPIIFRIEFSFLLKRPLLPPSNLLDFLDSWPWTTSLASAR